jgi:DNA topoisomerase III
MSKSLIITEKPSVTRDIVEALGGFEEKKGGEYFESDDYICTFAVGHILGFFQPEDIDPNYKRWRLADLPIIPEKFQTKPVNGHEKRIKMIDKLIKRADVTSLVNACDAAREGELIFREIISYTESQKPIKRLWLQSMTQKAIRDGFVKLKEGSDYEGLAAAAECRARSDWLIGMNATRALTVRLKSRSQRGTSWSAGRVQTPTLALLVERELKILAHVPKPFFKINVNFSAPDHEYVGTWYDPAFKKSADDPELRADRVFSKDQVDHICEQVSNHPAVAAETRKPKMRAAPLLLDLTSAQKEANRRFGWSAKRTLGAAQRCYERHKMLTYPRTSSRVLPEDYRSEVDKILNALEANSSYKPHIETLAANGKKNDKKIFNDAGVTDHFAIIPTGVVSKLDGDDARFYDLVARTFIAAFYSPAIFEEVERKTIINENYFRTKPPPVLKTPGWMAVFDKEKEEQYSKLPPLKPGSDNVDKVAVKALKPEVEENETRPLSRIGEAGLLNLMENAGRQVEDQELSQALQRAEGLGTAATRADIIENLKTKEYVDQALRPTSKGIRLIDVLHRIHAKTLVSAELTAQLEFHLYEVEEGKRSAAEFMTEIAEITRTVVESARNFDYQEIYPDVEPLGECPKCKRLLFEKAWFYGCAESTKRDGPKECDFLIWKEFYGRYIDRQTVRTLIEKGETRELDGFRDPNGLMYKAVITMENGTLTRQSPSQALPEGVTITVNAEPLGGCPVHTEQECKVNETQVDFVCQKLHKSREEGDRSAAGFSFPRILCKREMKREEVIDLICKKQTEFLQRFISKRGRPFSAKLVLQATGKFTFEFPERKPKEKPVKSTEDSESPKSVAPKKVAKKAAKKTTKKVAAKKSETTTKKTTTKKATKKTSVTRSKTTKPELTESADS